MFFTIQGNFLSIYVLNFVVTMGCSFETPNSLRIFVRELGDQWATSFAQTKGLRGVSGEFDLTEIGELLYHYFYCKMEIHAYSY